MDNNTSVLQVQRSDSEFTGFRCLKYINESNTSPHRLRWLWERTSECDYVFDDHTRGKLDFFLAQFADPTNEFYEIGENGLVVISYITEGGGSNIHYVIWEAMQPTNQRKAAVEVFDYLFFKRKVHHVVGLIPSYNRVGIRFALSMGMKFEGEIREDALNRGRYYSTHIYGILESEYTSKRGRLI